MRGMSAPFEIRQLVHASAFYMGRHLVATCAGSLFHVSMVHVYDFYISCMLPPMCMIHIQMVMIHGSPPTKKTDDYKAN